LQPARAFNTRLRLEVKPEAQTVCASHDVIQHRRGLQGDIGAAGEALRHDRRRSVHDVLDIEKELVLRAVRPFEIEAKRGIDVQRPGLIVIADGRIVRGRRRAGTGALDPVVVLHARAHEPSRRAEGERIARVGQGEIVTPFRLLGTHHLDGRRQAIVGGVGDIVRAYPVKPDAAAPTGNQVRQVEVVVPLEVDAFHRLRRQVDRRIGDLDLGRVRRQAWRDADPIVS